MKLKFIAVGAGDRGNVYGNCALNYHRDVVQYAAVAEPIAERRKAFAATHNIEPEHQFDSWEAVLNRPKLADAVIITTPDQHHLKPTLAALEAGYDVLLEKPMANTLADCVAIAQAEQQSA